MITNASHILTTQFFTFPNINPVIFEIGPLAVRWYSLAYLLGIYLGAIYMRYLDAGRHKILSAIDYDNLISYTIIGIVLGGRVGYVAFYEPLSSFLHPLHVINTLSGGMSFHGGLLGLIIAVYIFSRRNKIKFVSLFDLIACTAPIGLFLGRIANFINGELYGRVTNSRWGIVFPEGGPYPRHASQIYEAITEGLLIFVILWLFYRKTCLSNYPGIICGSFLILYSLCRTLIENYRQPDVHIGFIYNYFTMGQLLSLPMFMLGSSLILLAIRKR